MKYGDWYSKAAKPFRNWPLETVDRVLVALVAIAYIATGGYLAATGDARLWRFLLVPAATFVIVSAVRAAIDAPRPYEMHSVRPLIAKETRGKSMPSRHLASAVIIACALAWIDMRLGVAALVASALIGATRIVGGVHFPRDIAAAAAIAALFGFIGFVVIP